MVVKLCKLLVPKRVTPQPNQNHQMTECIQQKFEFQGLGSKKVVADFTGGTLSSDGGALLLREVESRKNIIRELSKCFTDLRNQFYVEHSIEELLSQRIYGIALGYEDLNDHDALRHDPLLALSCNKSDILGSNRDDANKGKALAGKSTLNRLELAAGGALGKDKKITANAAAIEDLLIELGVRAIPRKSKCIVLDFDATDDLIHGNQDGKFYHGYYRSYCFLPLYCFCGNIPLWTQLRTSNRDGADGTVEALEKIVPAIRKRFGKKVNIIVRADGGYCREAIMAWCESNDLKYCLGLPQNKRLQKELEEEFAKLETEIDPEDFQPLRRFKDFEYSTLKSWSCKRRVVGKAELLEKGRNPRFIVTNFTKQEYEAQELYEDFYCARGEMENRIKEQQQDLFADRTSSSRFETNQLRLWFSAFAHLIIEELRVDVLMETSLAKATIGQIRLKLFKIAARITVSVRRVYIQWSSSTPYRSNLIRAHSAL